MYKFISRNNIVIIDKENKTVILNITEFNIDEIQVFDEKNIRLNFGKYTIKSKDKIMTLTDNIEDIVDTLYFVEKTLETDQDRKEVYTVKKNTYITINFSKNTIHAPIYDNESNVYSNKKTESSDEFNIVSGKKPKSGKGRPPITKNKKTVIWGEFPITSKKRVGSIYVYTCIAGSLHISQDDKRPSKWDNITISKLKK